jgi:hypothetical protein
VAQIAAASVAAAVAQIGDAVESAAEMEGVEAAAAAAAAAAAVVAAAAAAAAAAEVVPAAEVIAAAVDTDNTGYVGDMFRDDGDLDHGNVDFQSTVDLAAELGRVLDDSPVLDDADLDWSGIRFVRDVNLDQTEASSTYRQEYIKGALRGLSSSATRTQREVDINAAFGLWAEARAGLVGVGLSPALPKGPPLGKLQEEKDPNWKMPVIVNHFIPSSLKGDDQLYRFTKKCQYMKTLREV